VCAELGAALCKLLQINLKKANVSAIHITLRVDPGTASHLSLSSTPSNGNGTLNMNLSVLSKRWAWENMIM
jgi:hypothetical protein